MSLASPPSLPRRIVNDPLILGGRWHLADTAIAIGEVRLDHAARGCQPGYRYPGLSPDELAACLAFDFPATREPSVGMLAGVVVIACVCGEDTSAVGGLNDPINCVCGRIWRLRLLLDLLRDSGRAVSDTSAAVVETAAP